jgi:hypothetical protein
MIDLKKLCGIGRFRLPCVATSADAYCKVYATQPILPA